MPKDLLYNESFVAAIQARKGHPTLRFTYLPTSTYPRNPTCPNRHAEILRAPTCEVTSFQGSGRPSSVRILKTSLHAMDPHVSNGLLQDRKTRSSGLAPCLQCRRVEQTIRRMRNQDLLPRHELGLVERVRPRGVDAITCIKPRQ